MLNGDQQRKYRTGKGWTLQDVYPIKSKDSLTSWVTVAFHIRAIITLGNILAARKHTWHHSRGTYFYCRIWQKWFPRKGSAEFHAVTYSNTAAISFPHSERTCEHVCVLAYSPQSLRLSKQNNHRMKIFTLRTCGQTKSFFYLKAKTGIHSQRLR